MSSGPDSSTVLFGSPTAKERPAPHVLFVIDSQSLSDPISVENIILKLLLYFHLHVNPQFTWGFVVFDPNSSFNTTSPRNVYDFNASSLSSFARDLDAMRRIGNPKHQGRLTLLLSYIRNVIAQTPWHQAASVPFQSPVKRARLSSIKSYKVRNFLYVVSPLPTSCESLHVTMGLSSFAHSQGLNSADALAALQADLLNDTFVEDLTHHRISFSWLDTSIYSDKVGLDIQWDICSMLQVIGPGLLPTQTCQTSLKDLFDLFRQKMVDLRALQSLGRQTRYEWRKKGCTRSRQQNVLFEGSIISNLDSISELQCYISSVSTPDSITRITNIRGHSLCKIVLSTLRKLLQAPSVLLSPHESAVDYFINATKQSYDSSNPNFLLVEMDIISKTTSFSDSPLEGGETNPFLDEEPNATKTHEPQSHTIPTETRLGVVMPYLPGLVLIFFVSKELEPELLDSNPVNAVACPCWNEDSMPSEWTSGRFSAVLKHFLASGDIKTEKDGHYLESICFGLYQLESQKSTLPTLPLPNDSITQTVQVNKKHPKAPSTGDSLQNIPPTHEWKTDTDIYNYLEFSYLEILYTQKTLISLVQEDIPAAIQALLDMFERGIIAEDPAGTLLAFYKDRLLLSIDSLESKYEGLQDVLRDLPSKNEVERQGMINGTHLGLREKEVLFVANLMNRFISSVDPNEWKSTLRSRLRDMKAKEAQLQLTLWLECLRVHQQTQTPLPQIKLFHPKKKSSKSKRNKKDKVVQVDADHYAKAIDALMDRICIWCAVDVPLFEIEQLDISGDGAQKEEGGSGENPLWKTFVQPIIVTFYSEQLPDLVQSLVEKAGGEVQLEEPIEMVSPTFDFESSRPKMKRSTSPLSMTTISTQEYRDVKRPGDGKGKSPSSSTEGTSTAPARRRAVLNLNRRVVNMKPSGTHAKLKKKGTSASDADRSRRSKRERDLVPSLTKSSMDGSKKKRLSRSSEPISTSRDETQSKLTLDDFLLMSSPSKPVSSRNVKAPAREFCLPDDVSARTYVPCTPTPKKKKRTSIPHRVLSTPTKDKVKEVAETPFAARLRSVV